MISTKKVKKTLLKNKLLVLTCLLCVSCKQTVVIHETVMIDEPATKSDLLEFIQASLINWPFAFWLVGLSVAAVVLWKNSYCLLKWFQNLYLSCKVVAVLIFLVSLYAIGCIPLHTYGAWFALPVIAFFWSTCSVFISLVKRYRFRIKDKNTKSSDPDVVQHRRNVRLLARVMFLVWSSGWVFYFVAIAIACKPHVGAEVLLRSAIASFNLFLTNIDSTIIDSVKDYDVLKGLISCTGFSATLCTILLILSLALARLKAYLHVKHILINGEHNHLYIFFGINDASKLLSQSIYNGDSQSVIVFVDSQDGKLEQGDDNNSWQNIVSILIHRRKAFLDVNENERRALAIANCNICSLEEETSHVLSDVLGNVGIESVKRHIQELKRVKDAQLHVLFLSEDRETNVRSTAILAKDELVGSKEFQTTIYCHARRNSVNRIIEDLNIGTEKRIEVKILDSSHLAVEHLKRDVRNHPVNFVSVQKISEDNPGTVSSDFVSLVMGFGETGHEAVEFLYEYGAFVHKDASAQNSYRSPFCCHVMDCDMKLLEGHFVSGIPNVCCKPSGEREENTELIKLYDCDYRSGLFFTNVLDAIAQKLNYVIVAIGDDENNMTAAVEILRYVRKKRENLDNFHIYVRAYEKGSFKHLTEIAKHYNMRLSEEGNNPMEKITLFGQNEQIYTYDLVVKDKYLEEGKDYYETYRSLNIDSANDEGPWQKRHDDTMNGKGTKWERMSKIRRKESQDRSNALHAQTKIMLLQKAVGEENVKDFVCRTLEGRSGRQAGISYPRLSPSENRLMLNLAMCEHLRWNAAHEMMGYVNNTVEHACNELRKKHNCLKPWQDLDTESDAVSYIDDYKVFDFGVVETSFKLELKDNGCQ